MSVAALDLGTNSTRLLIVDDAGRELARASTVTRLGAGVDKSRVLTADGIARTTDCLRAYRLLLDEHGVSRMRAVTTSAARDAGNRDELFEAAAAALGFPVDLLSGAEEGRLGFVGATAGLTPGPDAALDMVVDIGGGSTEFVVGRPGEEPLGVWSADIGCVRVTELYLHSNRPTAEELSSGVTVTHAHLDDVQREVPPSDEATRLIGVGGSITTVAAVEIGLATYDRDRIHHFVLTRAAVEAVFRTLATEKRADRACNPGLPVDRVDTIVGGALILATVMRHFDLDTCLVSERDLLDGIVASLLAG